MQDVSSPLLETPEPRYQDHVVRYLGALRKLSAEDIGTLRKMADRKISDCPRAFSIFANSIWWKTKGPYERDEEDRELLWLAAKLYASGVPHKNGEKLLTKLSEAFLRNQGQRELFLKNIQNIVSQPSPLPSEREFRWALNQVCGPIDWRDFLSDLFAWNHDTRVRWVSHFYQA